MYETICLHAIASEKEKAKKEKLGMVSCNVFLVGLSFNYSQYSAYAISENVSTSAEIFKAQMTKS